VSISAEITRLASVKPVDFSDDATGDVDLREGQDSPGPLTRNDTLGDVDGVEWAVRRTMHEIWNRRLIGSVDDLYAENVTYHGPNRRELYGRGDVKQEILAMLAMLPDARMFVDEVYHNEVEPDLFKVAVRWTLVGTNLGPSRYGPPCGRRLRIMGLSQWLQRGGRVVEDWTVFSELSLMRQMTRQQT
jgi:hypothetical protein